MDKISKFLLKLSQKDREMILFLMQKILSWELDWLDIKKISWESDLYRIRKWKIRIIFRKWDTSGTIIDINYRDKIYNNF